ncbi:MAG: SDR family oxidoreductase [Arenicella sp.]
MNTIDKLNQRETDMIDLTNKTALITGASRGIGAAIAKELSACGATVILAARTETAIQSNAHEINTAGGKAYAISCDVSQYSELQAASSFCLEQSGSLDILINNAGVIEPISRLADSDPDLWSCAVDINFKGVYFGMRAAIPIMEKQGSGTIINLSSGAANGALEGWSHYCSTKSAAQKLTECAHKEYFDRGIRVIGLSPGTVATDMMSTIKESGVNPVSQLDWSVHIPAEWPAKAVAYLCSEGGDDFVGSDFSLKTELGRQKVGLPW